MSKSHVRKQIRKLRSLIPKTEAEDKDSALLLECMCDVFQFLVERVDRSIVNEEDGTEGPAPAAPKLEMTPSERLKEIEERLQGQIARCIGGSFSAIQHARYDFSINAENDIKYLLNRVKRLTEALEFYAGAFDKKLTASMMGEYTPFNIDRGALARKALEGEE